METGIKRVLLTLLLAAGCGLAQAAEEQFEPQLERRQISEDLIDSEDFQIGAFAGVLSIEDFGSNFLWGAHAAYHLSEDLFIDAAYASSKGGMTSYEKLSGAAPLLTDSDREFSMYMLSLGYNIFPGEAFVFSDTAFNTAFFITAGGGSTQFAGQDNFTASLGFGYRVLMNDWAAVEFTAKDYLFSLDVTGEDKLTHNLAFAAGLSVFF